MKLLVLSNDLHSDISDIICKRFLFKKSNISFKAQHFCYAESGNWSEWSRFSSCNQACNGGEMHRTRICLSRPCFGPSNDTAPCNTSPCNIR